jgi:hypothetical protein
MSSCPNKNLPEWKALEKEVGNLEAMRDYLETKGEIRSPEVVKNKLEMRKEIPGSVMYPKSTIPAGNFTLADIANDQLGQEDHYGINVDQLKSTRAIELANKMSAALNVEYEMVTAEQAALITQNAINPWSGEAAFFVGGKVYFIQDKMSSDMVFHEFAHPLVRAISKENPELFDKLYNDVINTDEGQVILREVIEGYTALEQDSVYFKEEVIVKALEKNGSQKLSKEKVPGPFAKAIAEFLFAIKQLLRGKFGKSIKVSKLSTDTTLNELADILTAGDKISIDTELISEEDIVAYNKEAQAELNKDLDSVRKQDIQATVNDFYEKITSHMSELTHNENYTALADVLVNENGIKIYQAMKGNLKPHHAAIMSKAKSVLESAEEAKKRTEALTNTLFQLEDVMQKMHDHTQDIASQPDTQANLQQAYYYKKFTDHWSEFITNLKNTLEASENGVDSRSSIVGMVSAIERDISKTGKLIDKMYADGSRDSLYEQLEPLNRAISERYEERIKWLEEKGASPKRLDKVYKEYHGVNKADKLIMDGLMAKYKDGSITTTEQNQLDQLVVAGKKGLSITREKIELLLKGKMGDANYFSSYLEGYLYNPDPIIGGLALFVKNATNEVMIVTQQKYNAFANDIRDDLKAAGYNPNRVGQLGKDVGRRDKIGVIDQETGKLVSKEVMAFMHEFKDYRYDEDSFKKDLQLAREDYDTNGGDERKAAYMAAEKAYNDFQRDYMHREYVKEYYEREALFEGDKIGEEASLARREIMEEMHSITSLAKTQSDHLDLASELDTLWRKYRLLHSMYNSKGQLKQGEDAAIALRLRQYRDAGAKFQEYKVRKGAFENAYLNYQQELRNQPDMVESSDPESDWMKKMDIWKRRNSRITIKPEWYTERTRILEEIKTIVKKYDKLGTEQNELDQGAVWEKILNLVQPYKDDDGQTIAIDLTPEQIDEVRDLQLTLQEIKDNAIQRSGLTKEENAELNQIFKDLKDKVKIDWNRKAELEQLKEERGINKWDAAKLTGLYEELGAMSEKDATDYYADTLNEMLGNLDLSGMEELSGMDKTNVDILLKPETLDKLFSQGEAGAQFEKWFEANHIRSEVYNKELKAKELKYERLYIWNVTKPSDSSMMESYEIKDVAGNVLDVVEGLPSQTYYTRSVKPEYQTRHIPGVTKDNKNRWMPKNESAGAKDDKYIDQEYAQMKADDTPMYKLLEKLKKHHLANQEELPYNSRLGLDFPRYRQNEMEFLQNTTLGKESAKKKNALTMLMKRAKGFMTGEKDDAADGTMNYDTRMNLVRADMFDNDMTDIPISGLYDIDVNDVSTDITLSMMRYMMSGERQKQLIKISPVVRAIQDTVNNNKIEDTSKVLKKNFINGVLKYAGKKDNVRAAAVNNFIEREFDGKTKTGLGSESAFLTNFSNILFKRASFTFFALNIPSALKNSLGMKFQSMIEAAGGQHVDQWSLQKGNAWAYKAMQELSFGGNLTTKGTKSHRLQLWDVFDFAQGRYEDKFATEMSRNAGQDIVGMSWLYSPRKWVELQATAQLGAGMLHKKKVTQIQEDGTPKEIPYIEAFETVDGQIRLKKGIDVRYGLNPEIYAIKSGDTLESIAAKYNIPVEEIDKAFRGISIQDKLNVAEDIEYRRNEELDLIQQSVDNLDPASERYEHAKTVVMDKTNAVNKKYDAQLLKDAAIKIDNSEFKYMKNKMQQVQNNMGGAYSKFDQPEAQRYLAFRFITYMRRYFTTMATNRWGVKRLSPGMGGSTEGFYITTGKWLVDAVTSLGSSMKFSSKEEKVAGLKFITEMGMLMLTSALTGWIFGWDADDDDRYEKLREKSGPMNLLGLTTEDPDRPFQLGGWLEVHALHTLMQVRAENEQFNVFTGGIKQYSSLVDVKSVVFGPTTDSYVTMWDDLKKIVTGDPKAYYTRNVGPYDWQQKGGSKFMTHFAKTFGLTGSSLDGALAVQNFQSYQAKVR